MSTGSLAGQTLGQYELRELVGESGMGAVYRAYQASLQREVAVKVMAAALASQPGYVERFTREARTAAALEHAHIVPVYDYGTQGDISYIVMRLLTGGSLEQRISRGDRLPSLKETGDLLDQLASALDYAHARGVIHRDIKASNVMFDDQGIAYLVDFGIAKLLNVPGVTTTTGQVIGTPAYMAPEQWRDEQITAATDQYALGVLVYVTLTGKLPFEASTPHALMHKHLHEPPRPPNVWRPDLPDAVKPVLDKALAKNPHDRYRSVGAFAEAFKQVVGAISAAETIADKRSPASAAVSQSGPAPAEESAGEPPTTPTTSAPVTGALSAPSRAALWRAGGVILLLLALGILALYEDANRQTRLALTSTAQAALLAATETPTPTDTLTATASRTATVARTATFTPSPTPTPAATDTATPTPTRTPTATASRTASNTPTTTVTPTATATLKLTATETPIPAKSTVTGTLTPAQVPGRHTFVWQTGDVVRMELTTDGFDPYLILADAAGNVVAENDDCGDLRTSCIGLLQLQADGAYVVIIDSFDTGSSGEYTLDITYISACTRDEAMAVVTSPRPDVNFRRGPGLNHPVVGNVHKDDCLAVIGRNTSSSWLQIRTVSGRTGWISASLVIVFGALKDVPVADN